MTPRRTFGSTYRLQLNGVGFAAAAGIVPFLHDLGIETCYVSPITRARANSAHGYDVVDPTVLDPALGTAVDYELLLAALGDRGMTLLIDIVPNHMAASTENPFFADVLRHGQASRFAAYFDIDWSQHDGKLMLPVLGGALDDVLAAGEIRLVRDDPSGDLAVAYFDHRFPIDPVSLTDGIADAPVGDVLSRQHYLLADWRLANSRLNYRRFFDINELIGVRQEDPDVFTATHRLIRELVADPRVAGLRVDHVDGLRDPAGYLAALRDATSTDAAKPVIEIEKILERDEHVPDWPVDGTTGYEFAVAVTGLFVDPDGAGRLASATGQATGDDRSFATRALAAKRDVLATLFERQLGRVSDLMAQAIGRDVAAAVAELTAQLDVYRTYRRPNEPVTADDLQRVRSASERARTALAATDAGALDDVVALISGDLTPDTPGAEAVAAWQQLTSPATAKGVEDTALYDPGRLLATADVGGDPDRGAVTVADFHALMRERRDRSPLGLSTLSTHDSKRSQDVRCRLAVLSEIPDRWDSTMTRLDASLPAGVADVIDAAERRYVYETLVGVWPLDDGITEDFLARIDEHIVKAAREAKRHSGWTSPDTNHEDRLREFVRELLTEPADSRRRAIRQVVSAVEVAGAANSLASVVVRAAAPGVPDVYQGDDAWFFALVDPDNRRPFDLSAHAALLRTLPEPGPGSQAALRDAQAAELVTNWRDGRLKQLLVRQSLQLRRRWEFFDDAAYQPLEVVGLHRDAVLAFARTTAERTVLCVVPVRAHAVGNGEFPIGAQMWGDTAVKVPDASGTSYTDAVTAASIDSPAGLVPAGEIFRLLPVGLLEQSR